MTRAAMVSRFTVAVVLAAGLTACGGGGGPGDLTLASSPTTVPVPTTASTTASSTTSATGPPPSLSSVATARVASLDVYETPGSANPMLQLTNPWGPVRSDQSVRVPQVFRVEEQRSDGWVEVSLPVLPTGTSGWVRSSEVTISKVGYAIRVVLSTRRITVFRLGKVQYEGPAAVGALATPTPTGEFCVRAIFKVPDPNTVAGPNVLGMSSHSNSVTSFSGADGEVAIHGNNDASALGAPVTQGSIRIDNSEIKKLAGVLPLGTPVDVVG
jgi:lipoprotein-anchoring transpeptidase ErfK/SrfK